jgi:putative ABC transport system substrate-binding protein
MYIADASTSSHLVKAFEDGLRNSGIVPGRNATVVYRWAEGKPDRLPLIAKELVTEGVSVIVAAPTTSQ